jgi:dethiobiotin synthetase
VRGLFVTGTDTGVGKTILSAAIVAAMAAAGERVRAYKPVLTGTEEEPQGPWPADHRLLGAAAGMTPEQVAPLRFAPPVSPHLAAQLAGERIEPERLLSTARAYAEGTTLVVEGVGGLLVPLVGDWTVRELAVALRLPVLIAARPGLGTINHTLLTLEAARAAGIDVRAVVLTPWPERPNEMERSNRATIEALGGVPVQPLPTLGGPDVGELARAGETLPWREWIGSDAAPSYEAVPSYEAGPS